MQIEIGSKITVLSHYNGADCLGVEVFVFWHGAEHRVSELVSDASYNYNVEDWTRKQIDTDHLVINNEKLNASIILQRKELKIYGG